MESLLAYRFESVLLGHLRIHHTSWRPPRADLQPSIQRMRREAAVKTSAAQCQQPTAPGPTLGWYYVLGMKSACFLHCHPSFNGMILDLGINCPNLTLTHL